MLTSIKQPSVILVFAILVSSSASFVLGNPISGVFGACDFDGDHKTDLAVFRPSDGKWYLNQSAIGIGEVQLGHSEDIPVPADFDGDGKTDAAVYRAGVWSFLMSTEASPDTVTFGSSGDIPISVDFDGDGRADVAVFRPSTGEWFWINSSNEMQSNQRFGQAGDIPVAMDYDGDGRTDAAVFRPSNATWYWSNSSDGVITAVQFGISSDVPVPADFDADGKAEPAVWRPSEGWYMLAADSSTHFVSFGLPNDTPVPADYDGDGKADIAVWRPSTGQWYRIASSSGLTSADSWGLNSDIPLLGIRNPQRALPNPASTVTDSSPNPTGTAPTTETATATPSASPTAGPPTFTCDYYASPTGTAGGAGSGASPWDLQTAFSKTLLITNGKTLCLKGGTYSGKFISTLNGGGTVRSSPGEWAKIDGYLTTQLNGAITGSQTTLTVASATNIADGSVLSIDTEHVLVTSTVAGNTRTVMRGWNGTTPAAHPSGAVVTHVGNQLTLNGDNTTYRDLEITNSSPQRDLTPPGLDDQGCCGFYSKIRGAGVVIANRSGNSLINLIVHDNLDGIFTGSSSSNTLVYGCVTYNNGGHWTNPIEGERGAGNGMYLENSAGYSRVYDTISVNNFGHGGQFFGVTGPYVGGDVQGSVFANAGSPMRGIDPNIAYRNMLFGADSQVVPTASVTNSHFYHPAGMGYSVNFGYGAGILLGIFTNNYVIGSGTGFEASSVTSLTMTGNKFYSAGSGDKYVISKRLLFFWNNNTYYATTAAQARFGDSTGGNNLNFTGWKTATGFDLLSTATTSAMPDTVIVRPNAYTAGRANVVVYAPSGAASINVNLSTSRLTNGQSYTIKNAFNYFGPNVASGTYNSSSPTISLPLTGAAASVATPKGSDFTPVTTCPAFCSLIVVAN